MKCLDCSLKYVGQTGRTSDTRYKEHIHDIRNNNRNTGYSNHTLNTGHTYGTVTESMEIITTGKMGIYLNTYTSPPHTNIYYSPSPTYKMQ
jgi:hypothetical protein